MKLYPVTNTIVDGNDAQAEELNKNTQVCFEAANGGLDRHNFPATSLEAKDFQGRTFNAFYTHSGTEDATPVYTLNARMDAWAPYRFDAKTHTNTKQGIASGMLQIRFLVGSIGFDFEDSLIDYKDEAGLKNNLPKTVYSIYANGLKVGETEGVFKANRGTVSVPFYFYNPGGTVNIELFCSSHNGSLQNGETVRLTIENYMYYFNVRVR
tara:strand:+ start:1561 stop:2190 length:630 start_codon:yes stop_codon:yes gene_type:complete